jgi:hypothetical protein
MLVRLAVETQGTKIPCRHHCPSKKIQQTPVPSSQMQVRRYHRHQVIRCGHRAVTTAKVDGVVMGHYGAPDDTPAVNPPDFSPCMHARASKM